MWITLSPSVYINPSYTNLYSFIKFVLKSQMKAVSSMEEFTCSLGTDASVRVEYKPVKKYREESGMFMKSTVTMHDQAIEIKNTKQEDVKVKLLEHIPLSEDERIKVHITLLERFIYINTP